MQGRPEYKADFSPGEQQVTWWLLATILVIAVGFWRTDVDRRRSRATPRWPVALT